MVYYRYFNGLLFLWLVLVLAACGDDPVIPRDPIGMEGRWVAVENDIAPLFRREPFHFDSIYLEVAMSDQGTGRPLLFISAHDSSNGIRYVYIKNETFNDNQAIGASILNMVPIRQTPPPGQDQENDREDAADTLLWEVETTSPGYFYNPLSPNDVENHVFGIFQVKQDGTRKELLLEFVFGYWHSQGITRPSVELGFGSTMGGAFGMDNVHRFTSFEARP